VTALAPSTNVDALAPELLWQARPALVLDRLPPIRLRDHEGGSDVELPGALWPDAAVKAALANGGRGGYLGGFRLLTRKKHASEYLLRWGHQLHLDGRGYRRPYGFQGIVFDFFGEDAALTVSGSYPNEHIAGLRPENADLDRYNTVDLARICRAPQARHYRATKLVLTTWLGYGVPMWAAAYDYSPLAAVTLSMPNTAGDIYRWCGFRKQSERPVSRSGGGHQPHGSIITQLAERQLEEQLTTGLWVHRFDRPQVTPSPAPQPATPCAPRTQLCLL
jgi:hypothetical protein